MNKKWFAILLAIGLVSCRKGVEESGLPVTSAPPTVTNLPITVTIDQNHPGYTIPQSFEGLSYETSLLAENPEFLNENNKVLIQLTKNLGKGLLRIGGNSSDSVAWRGRDAANDTTVEVITPADIDRLAAFSQATGWPVLFGLNLGNNDTKAAAYEARYVYHKLNNNLYAFQNGNEPDVFNLSLRTSKYNYFYYEDEWYNYLEAIKKKVPDARFAGPDVTPFNSNWLTLFAKDEHQNVRLIDCHFYNGGPASVPSINCNDVLTQNIKLPGYLRALNEVSTQYNVPYRISECNSIFGKGKHGVSDVFASSLWALDFMWAVAENGGQGVNFHGGTSSFVYSPIADDDGIFTARPVYYAMLAFKYGAVGQTILPHNLSEKGYNLRVHACVNAGGTYAVTLINKEINSSFSVTIQLDNTASKIDIARLTASAVTTASGITFAGSAVNADGTFKPRITERQNVNDKSFVVNVPAGSAAIVTIR